MMKNITRILAVVLIIVLCVALYRWRAAHHAMPLRAPASTGLYVDSVTGNENVTASRHPIKAGGVKNAADLYMLIRNNPDVAAHYAAAGFDPLCMSEQKLPENTWARVSYRTANGFAYTKAPLLLLAGTSVIWDCHGHAVKMNCGNVLLIDKFPVSPDEESFTTLLPAEGIPSESLPFPVPNIPVPVAPVPPVVIPPTGYYPPTVCCFVGGAPIPPHSVPTPENSVLSMLAIGLVALVLGISQKKPTSRKRWGPQD